MKRLLITAFLALALGRVALAGPGPIFSNTGSIVAPGQQQIPQVDDIIFFNSGLFSIGLPAGNYTTPNLYGFAEVLYYTNQGTMLCDTGFNFNNAPAGNGVVRAASSFLNSNTGSISAGSFISSNSIILINSSVSTFPELLLSVTNVTNTGLLDVGPLGLINMEGVNLNLKRGTIHAEGFDDTLLVNTFGFTGFPTPSAIGGRQRLRQCGAFLMIIGVLASKPTLPPSLNSASIPVRTLKI